MSWIDNYKRFRDGFAAAMNPQLYTIEYLDQRVLEGTALFMCTDNAAIVAEILTYPTGAKDIHGLVMAGDAREVVDVLIPRAEEWAIAHGCIGALIESRPAWQKLLKTNGYELHQVAVRKEL